MSEIVTGLPEFYQPGNYKRSESLGWLLHRARQLMTQQIDQRLVQQGLTHAQWLPLFLLRMSGPSSVASLVRELDTDAGAMTRLLDRLEAKGLCLRQRCTDDRRVVTVALTEEGQRVTAELPAVLSDVFNDHLKGFSSEEWRLLLSLLQRLIGNGEALRQAHAEPKTPES